MTVPQAFEPLTITPHATVSGMARAMDADEGGFQVTGKFIQVGTGRQVIELDDAGAAITDTLLEPVGYIEILRADRVNDHQWLMVVDLRNLQIAEWNLSEFALCDANKEIIAIYGNADRGIYPVNEYLSNALLGINFVMGVFPADSIVIEHHNLPLEMIHDDKSKYAVLSVCDFGAVGDYSTAQETAGYAAVFATDNYPAFRAARDRLLEIGGGTLVIPMDAAGGDYYCSNMSTFDMSNLHIDVQRGATVRCELPTSHGAVFTLGGVDKENISISGGGKVRSHMPVAAQIPLWVASKSIALGDYVKTTSNQVYYCSVSGVTGTVEPTTVNTTFSDGTATLRDALNNNAIAVRGKNLRVHNMIVPEASDKGITSQTPGSSMISIINNHVIKTFGKGIEVKGDQGDGSGLCQRIITIKDNVVEDAGAVGIEVEQPDTGVLLNEDAILRDNTIISAGVRHWNGGAGIRVNRCNAVDLGGNKVKWAEGPGFHIRRCIDITGDIRVEDCGKMGLHLQENERFKFSSVLICQNGAGHDAIREYGQKGDAEYGSCTVLSSGHSYGFRELLRGEGARVKAASMSISAGVDGRSFGGLPERPSISLSSANIDRITSIAGGANVAPTGRHEVLNINGMCSLFPGGIMYGPTSTRIEVTIDGGQKRQYLAGDGNDNDTDRIGLISIPPIRASTSLIIEANNNSSVTKDIGWSFMYLEGE